ncbi:MAG: hypothetical protein IPG68_07155 [Micrococcales bacterium]|nr:hypothetical protein [Micrococcales bacterium]
MSSTPRIIATTASAALLAATGAGAAVMAVDTVTAGSPQVAADATATTDSVPTPQDDRVTVYSSPSDDHDDDDYDEDSASGKHLQPAPPSTSFQGKTGGQTQSNTSKSS